MQIKTPNCPTCGSSNVTATGQSPNYAGLRLRPMEDCENPASWIIGFQCQCGLGFTEHVKNEPQNPLEE